MTQISAIQKGSEAAFTQVYEDFHIKLYRYFIKKTGSEEMAEELVQQVFIKLWRFKHTLSELYPLDTQLFNMARSCLIDLIRQKARYRAHFTALERETEANALIQPDMSYEMMDYFNHAVKSLPPVRKKVFILSRLRGLTYQEIAQQLSISIHTVEDHMTKAIRQIRDFSSLFWSLFILLSSLYVK